MFTLKLFAKEIPFQHFPIFRSHQPSVVFHIETIHFICSAIQLTGFFVKCNTVLRWVMKDQSKDNTYSVRLINPFLPSVLF